MCVFGLCGEGVFGGVVCVFFLCVVAVFLPVFFIRWKFSKVWKHAKTFLDFQKLKHFLHKLSKTFTSYHALPTSFFFFEKNVSCHLMTRSICVSSVFTVMWTTRIAPVRIVSKTKQTNNDGREERLQD